MEVRSKRCAIRLQAAESSNALLCQSAMRKVSGMFDPVPCVSFYARVRGWVAPFANHDLNLKPAGR